jgi:DNA integrity scanning protein DisA with diadenylate cyclase activity
MQTMLVTAHLLDKICSLKESASRPVLESVLTLALEISHEGRGGRKVGTIFMVFDSQEVLQRSKCLIYDPLLGHPEHLKNIENADMRETVKELARLDGAFIVSDESIVLSACRYLNASAEGINLLLGLGSRHMAAASMTRETQALAVVVSESSVVRVFAKGELIEELIPEVWVRSR